MAKKKSTVIFKCNKCGYTHPRWLGKCPDCGEWNSLIECITTDTALNSPFQNSTTEKIKPIPLSSVDPLSGARLITGIKELDGVLGGGATKRSAILIGGEPGIGKSTLLLQAASSVAQLHKGKILYISGEESASQIRNRADRLQISSNNIEILCTTKLEDIEDALNAINPLFTIVDSIQTVFSPEAGLVPGTVNQLKYCGNELIGWVKERDAVLCMTAHVTKEGVLAGPKSLEHMVDTVISFERNDDEVRFLRASKNRFGSVDELGIFSMTETGLHPIDDPSSLFLVQREDGIPAGAAIVPVFEGSRVFLVEIQALTVPAKASLSRVYSDKIDSARVSRVAAVLEKRIGIRFSDQDIYINVAGGVRLTESAIDAALACALYSARTDTPLPEKIVLVGELSLAGEIRPVNRLKQRIKAASSLGFMKVLGPADKEVTPDKTFAPVANIKSLIQKIK
jgi:DNA repair protein RadA/Sms